MFSNHNTGCLWAGYGVSHDETRGSGQRFTVSPQNSSPSPAQISATCGTRISTNSVKKDNRERFNTLELKCYF